MHGKECIMGKAAECALLKIRDDALERPAGLFCFHTVILSVSYKVQSLMVCVSVCVGGCVCLCVCVVKRSSFLM